MRSREELIQYLQERINDDQTKIEDLRDATLDLYHHNFPRPPINSNNKVIGIYHDQSQNSSDYKYEMLPEHLCNKSVIKFFLFWYADIVPIHDLLTNIGKLPYSRDSRVENEADFEIFITTKLSSYIDQINSIKTDFFLSTDDITAINENVEELLSSVRKYLDGFPEAAFSCLKRCMDRIEGLNLEPLFEKWWVDEPLKIFFKMRLGSSNHIYSANDMFHIPFEKRGLVKTNRYSIPGLPCVYLGSTPLTCWEEMGKPDLNTTHSSLFLPNKSLRFLDISIPPTAWVEHFVRGLQFMYGIKDLDQLYRMMRSYLILWPVMACCSIRVMNSEETFKPEYIVPQLLLQWIQQSGQYDGVSYFSTKFDDYTRKNFRAFQNFAFPVKERKAQGLCDLLRSKFDHITNAVPWQLFQIYKSTGLGNTAPCERNFELSLITNMPFNYATSDFGRLETYLINLLATEP